MRVVGEIEQALEKVLDLPELENVGISADLGIFELGKSEDEVLAIDVVFTTGVPDLSKFRNDNNIRETVRVVFQVITYANIDISCYLRTINYSTTKTRNLSPPFIIEVRIPFVLKCFLAPRGRSI